MFPHPVNDVPVGKPVPDDVAWVRSDRAKAYARHRGGTITFTSGTAYSYTGGKFGANSGTYRYN